jgi:hypothetical protein
MDILQAISPSPPDILSLPFLGARDLKAKMVQAL